MASQIVHLVCDESRLSFYSGFSNVMASDYALVACAATLQVTAEALSMMSTFSLAMDVCALHGVSYIDVHVWFFFNSKMYTFHVLEFPYSIGILD